MKRRSSLLVVFLTALAAALAQSPLSDDADEIRAKLREMTREQRAAWMRARPIEEVRALQAKMSAPRDAALAKDPFTGVTTDGNLVHGLFPIRQTGVSTRPVLEAAQGFLKALTPQQRSKTKFAVDDPEWRKWMNQHFYRRQGVGFDEMSSSQREAAFNLLRAALSPKGFKLSRDIMRLNHTLGELAFDNFAEYSEWLYWMTVMGEPSESEPWGWQIDGHHLIINYFVLGDQVVSTPLFVGSEPVIARGGKFKGVSILQDEQDRGLDFVRSLTNEQREKAILSSSKTRNNNVSEAFKDNVQLDYAGLRANSLDPQQKSALVELISLYTGNIRHGHAEIHLADIEQRLDDTYFAWIGGTESDSVFYYRVHSPVVLIEFDHQGPAGLPHIYERGKPMRDHIHAVVRTPNGNDYGKDLLRQHYERHPHGD